MLADAEPSPDVELLLELSARGLPEGQALHGDAHLANCMAGVDGPVWHDLETACRGPREYDLAALVHRHRLRGGSNSGLVALEAYGDHDGELLDEALLAYSAWIAASWLVALPRRPGLEPGLRQQLAFLRGHRR